MAKPTLTPEHVQRIVHALADPNRYDILTRVFAAEKPMTCTHAKGQLAIADATCSHHLKELLEADLIDMARQGRTRLLTPRRDTWKAFLRSLKAL